MMLKYEIMACCASNSTTAAAFQDISICDSGHYWAFGRYFSEKKGCWKWKEYNDSQVTSRTREYVAQNIRKCNMFLAVLVG